MKRAILVILVLALLPLVQTACATPSIIPSTTLVESTPTPIPTAAPTDAPINVSNARGFDTRAGNCADAANQAIALSQKAAAGQFGGVSFNMDMHLDLEPSTGAAGQGCAASGQTLQTYQEYVNTAQLQVWALDNGWYNAAQTTRQQWLSDVLAYLLRLYGHANITITVNANDAPCGSASAGAGQSGRPQINAACGG